MTEAKEAPKHCRERVPFPCARVYPRRIGTPSFLPLAVNSLTSVGFSLEVQADVSDCKSYDIESITISEKSSKTIDSLKALAGSIKYVLQRRRKIFLRDAPFVEMRAPRPVSNTAMILCLVLRAISTGGSRVC
jgi:hypothetical protein